MNNLKEQILKLRLEGKTYKEICLILNCSKGVVSYHCGEGQKERSGQRQINRRKELVILKKVENFQKRKFKPRKELSDRSPAKKLQDKTDDFQRERLGGARKRLGKRNITFKWQDVIEKFGWETTCYLTGRKLDLKEPRTYHFDHMVPVSKNGSFTLDNLGIACREANNAKSDLSKDELLFLCKEILEHNGYTVRKVE